MSKDNRKRKANPKYQSKGMLFIKGWQYRFLGAVPPYFSKNHPEVYSEPCQTECFGKIVKDIKCFYKILHPRCCTEFRIRLCDRRCIYIFFDKLI